MSQKAAILTEKGQKFEVQTIDKHIPQKGEILVKNHAIATNPADGIIQQYGIFISQYPVIIGFDVAGTVDEIGEGVTLFKKGDKVFGLTWVPFNIRKGAFQEYTILNVDWTSKIPENCSYEQAATLLAPALTAVSNLYVDLALTRPTSIERPRTSKDADIFYVNSGASAVGSAAIQLLVLNGYRVIATASPKNFELVKSFGASEVLYYNDPDLVQKVKAVAGKKINYALDAASNEDSLAKCIEILDGTGTLSTVKPGMSANLQKREVNVIDGVATRALENDDVCRWWWDFLKSAVEGGSFVGLAPEIIGTKIEDIQKAVDYHSSGKVSGTKPVIKLI